jgi:hypothetical protein
MYLYHPQFEDPSIEIAGFASRFSSLYLYDNSLATKLINHDFFFEREVLMFPYLVGYQSLRSASVD